MLIQIKEKSLTAHLKEMDVGESKRFNIELKKTLRSLISTRIYNSFPTRIYQTEVKPNYLIVTRLGDIDDLFQGL